MVTDSLWTGSVSGTNKRLLRRRALGGTPRNDEFLSVILTPPMAGEESNGFDMAQIRDSSADASE
jgi:hypothetical protein